MAGKQRVTDAEILDAVRRLGTRSGWKLGQELGLSERQMQRRLRDIGAQNIDGYLAGEMPGVGRDITKVVTLRDEMGVVKSSHVTEKPTIGDDHEPIIDAPIVRQSTLLGPTGEIVAQWNIRMPDDRVKALDAAIEAAKAEISPQEPFQQLDLPFEDDKINHYVLSDVHVAGILFEEDPEDYEGTVVRCFERMIQGSPRSRRAIVVNLGDWFNFDSLLPLTSRSKNILFSGMHYHDMVQVGVRMTRRIINTALLFHEYVDIVIVDGNHDDVSALWLRILIMTIYGEDPRVRIIDSDNGFFAMKVGETFLGWTHGHEKSIKDVKDLILAFADQYSAMWGQTSYRYIHHGHYHHLKKAEETGAEVIQHPTLAGRDQHAARKNFRNKRAAIGTTYSNVFGDCGEVIIRPEMVWK